MKNRSKILMALMISAVMTVTGVSPAMAEEIVLESEELQDTEDAAEVTVDTAEAAGEENQAAAEAEEDGSVSDFSAGEDASGAENTDTTDTTETAVPAEGIYQIKVTNKNKMFNVLNNACTLVVDKDGKMTVQLTLTGTGYSYMYAGTGAEAAAAGQSAWAPFYEKIVLQDETGDYGPWYTYDLPLSALDQEVTFSCYSSSKDKWYDRPLTFVSEGMTAGSEAVKSTATEAVDNTTVLADGEYTSDQLDFSWEGGTKRMQLSCDKLTVKDGKAEAAITFKGTGSTSNLQYLKANGTTYKKADGIIDGGSITWTIPVAVGKTNTVAALTTAMSAPHEVVYTFTVNQKVVPTETPVPTATPTATPAPTKAPAVKTVPAAKLAVSASKVYLKTKQSDTIGVIVTPSNTTDKVTYKSDKTSVAKVDQNGKITAGTKTGTAKITVTAGKLKKTVTVTVSKSASRVTKLAFSKSTMSVNKGAVKFLTVKTTPAKASTDLKWSSSNSKVVKVDKNGKITALKAGTATVTVSADGKKASVKITVKGNCTKVTLNKTSYKMSKGKTYQLKASTTPAATIETVKWTSSDSKIVKVDKNGKITALKKGTATITVTVGSKKAACKVTVK